IDIRDERAARLVEAEILRDVGGDLLDADAEPAALDLAGLLELLDDRAGDRGGNREADADGAAARRVDRRVDADHLPGEVDERAAGIAAVDRRVGLQEIVVG